jgi:hypothetical protein
VKAGDADICVLLKKMGEMQDAIDQMRGQLSALSKEHTDNLTSARETAKRPVDTKEPVLDQPRTVDIPSKDSSMRYNNNMKRMADVVKEFENEEWHTVQNKKKPREPPKYGTKDCSTAGKKLKAAKNKRSWHLYAGNLDKGTIANDVREFLTDNGIEVMSCEPVGDGNWDLRPAAFHIEINYDKKDLVMHESFWDVGVRVRNWTFPRKKKW